MTERRQTQGNAYCMLYLYKVGNRQDLPIGLEDKMVDPWGEGVDGEVIETGMRGLPRSWQWSSSICMVVAWVCSLCDNLLSCIALQSVCSLTILYVCYTSRERV